MDTETKTVQPEVEAVAETRAEAPGQAFEREGRNNNRRGERGDRQRRPRKQEPDDGFDHRVINVRRVSRMYKGGRRLRISTFVVVGDRAGRIGIGLGKGIDAQQAQAKAIEKAKKSLVMITLKGNTIPHEITFKHRASKVLLMPAAPGTGLVAGATVKAVAELAGVKDILTKVMGSTNQINVAYATLEALKSLRSTRL
jgi:small subunit ribosomal protein S5